MGCVASRKVQLVERIMTKWKYYEDNGEVVRELSSLLPYSPCLIRILVNRGLKTAQEIEHFLTPRLCYLTSHTALPDMDKAVKRIASAIKGREPFLIYGDCDVDGITSLALMVRTLRDEGAVVHYYVPRGEGYGLSVDILARYLAQGARLVISVDCGISNRDEALWAREHGMDLIICDHHESPEELPCAYAVVDPKRKDCVSAFRELAGCGVAAKLAQALWEYLHRGKEYHHPHLDLVALGTIADMVPLISDNRIYATLGLNALSATRKTGLRMLLGKGNFLDGVIDAEAISHKIAPFLNAAGRMGQGDIAAELMVTDDESYAAKLIEEIEKLNVARRARQSESFRIAQNLAEKSDGTGQDAILVVHGRGFETGVIGVTASRLARAYHRPSIVITLDEDPPVGSARGINDYDIRAALEASADLLIRYGGHKSAAGFTIAREQIPRFIERMKKVARDTLNPQDLEPTILIDADFPLANLSLELMDELRLLEPYGCGNRPPHFIWSKVAISEVSSFGMRNSHLRLRFEMEGENVFLNSCDAIGWAMGHLAEELASAGVADCVYHIDLGHWKSDGRCRVIIDDIRWDNRREEHSGIELQTELEFDGIT